MPEKTPAAFGFPCASPKSPLFALNRRAVRPINRKVFPVCQGTLGNSVLSSGTSPSQKTIVFIKLLRILRIAVVLLVFVGAVWLLYLKAREISPDDFQRNLAQIRPWQIWAAMGLVALNYFFLCSYDYLAIRYIGRPISLPKLGMAAFIGHVSSFNFGAILGGSFMRSRFYSAWGFSAVEVVQLIAILGITFWLGVLAIAGMVFVLAPFEVPAEVSQAIPQWLRPVFDLLMSDIRVFGFLLLVIVAGYVAICTVRRKPLNVFGAHIPLPPPWLTLGQIAVSCADLAIAAGVFYVLLPPEADISYIRCLGVFLLGMVAAVITHIPGGIGVFDVIMLSLLDQDTVAGAVAAYRVAYYLIPLAVAGLLLIGFEVVMGREFLKKLSQAPANADSSPQVPPGPGP